MKTRKAYLLLISIVVLLLYGFLGTYLDRGGVQHSLLTIITVPITIYPLVYFFILNWKKPRKFAFKSRSVQLAFYTGMFSLTALSIYFGLLSEYAHNLFISLTCLVLLFVLLLYASIYWLNHECD